MLDQLSPGDLVSGNDLKRLYFIVKPDSKVIDSRVAHIYEHCLVEQLSDYLRREYRTRFPGIFLSYGATTFLGYIMFQFAARDEQAMSPVRQFFRQSRSIPESAILEQCQRSVEAEVGMTYQIDDRAKFLGMIHLLTGLHFTELATGRPVYSAVTPVRRAYHAPWLRQRQANRSFRRMRIHLEIAEPSLSDYAILLSLTDLLRDLWREVMNRTGAYTLEQWVETNGDKLVVNLTYLVHRDIKRRQLTSQLGRALLTELSRGELDRSISEVKRAGSTIFYPDQLYNLTGRLMTTEVALEKCLTVENLRQALGRLRLAGVVYEPLSREYYGYDNQSSEHPR